MIQKKISFLYSSLSRRINSTIEWPLNKIGIFLFKISGIRYGDNLKLHGLPIFSIAANSRIFIGNNCRFRSRSFGNAIGINHPAVLRTLRSGAVLEIGDNVGMSGGAICAAGSIRIGNRVLIGANSIITDTDFHSLDPVQRGSFDEALEFRCVVIEDDVWIGADVYIGKGVTVGKGSVVGAKSVVTRDVPPNSIVAGNPARFIRIVSAS